jgi:outer membrane protein assembly factor BamB
MDLLLITSTTVRRPPAGRRWTSSFGCGFFAWMLVATACHAQQLQVQIANGPDTASENAYGVYLPTDRTLARGIAQARERIKDGEYNEAINFLQGILDQDEDTFLDDATGTSASQGLKATARQLIANLPAPGREAYQLLHAADARRGLEAALAADDAMQLARVVRQFSLTPAGCEAVLALAQLELDRGHPLAAAHLYQQLIDDRQAEEFEPQLSLLAANSWAVAGQSDRVVATLRALIRRDRGTTVELAGRTERLPQSSSSDAELIAWLTASVGLPQVAALSDRDWLTARGDPARNAANRGGAPHLSARWQARVVNEPRLESFLSGRREQFQQHGVAAIPAARPIAVGDVVLMRTPHNVVAIDFQTGKRIWETRADGSDTRDQALAGTPSSEEGDEPNSLAYPLEQRVWDDTLTNGLGSDGQRVFVLNDTTPTTPPENNGWGMGPGFGGPFDATTSPTNHLTAYDLASEGKLAWQLDGENGAGDLAGAFFLGPPLAVNDSLFVLAEIRSAVYLLALDPQSGHLQWRQQLAGLEVSIGADSARRLTGVMPSHAAGILICPTTAGMVVAVDIVNREFAWAYRYQRRTENAAINQQNIQGRPDVTLARDSNRWLDGSVAIADGRVFLSPPESAELHCLDLQTGKLLWKHQRDSSLLVGCIDQGTVLLVGNSSVTAKRVADGTPAWPIGRSAGQPKTADHLDFPANVQPAGLGYLSEGQYFLPLTSGHVVAIDLAKGTMTGSASIHSDAELGNLICHHGAVISQSALLLSRFEQVDVLRRRSEGILAQNPRDAAAIRDLAEMRRLDGALSEAITMLKHAYEIDANDPITREMLADSLLEAVAANYSAYQGDLPLLRVIAQSSQQQVDLLRIDAVGLQTLGERLPAFAAYLKLADALGRDPIPLRIDNNQTVRSDSWVRGRLRALWAESTPNERTTMSREIDSRRQSWGSSPTVNQMRRYLSQFGGLPGTDDVLLQLTRQLIGRRDSLDAEMALLKLGRSADPKIQAAATVLMAQWLLSCDRLEEARVAAAPLAEQWRDLPVLDDKSGGQWLAELHLDSTADRKTVGQDWPRGQVNVSVASTPTPTPAQRAVTLRARDEAPVGLRMLRVEQDYHPGLGTLQWFIAQDGSRLVGRSADGQDVFRWSAARDLIQKRFAINAEWAQWAQAAQLGDLFYVTLGNQVLALDCRQQSADTDAGIVWQQSPSVRSPVAPATAARRRGPSNIYHESSGRSRVSGPAGSFVGRLGPVTPWGVVTQVQQQLRCVDPLSGELLWTRTDVPTSSELFGDDEFVLAANADEGLVYLINIADGQIVDRRELPSGQWLLTAGRNVAQLLDTPNSQGRRKTLRIVDVVSGAEKYVAEYDSSTRIATIEPNAIALVEPPDRFQAATNAALAAFGVPVAVDTLAGKIQVVDVRTGKLIIDQSAKRIGQPNKMYALKAGQQLFLTVSDETRRPQDEARRPQSATIGLFDYPIVNGQLYAFDLPTGQPSWPEPATIAHRGLALVSPNDVPLLMFVDHVQKREATNTGAQLRLLCLDKRTGATVYRNDDLPATAGQQFRVRAAHDMPPTVNIEMSTRTVRLEFSDRPRPPEPPANDLVEAPRKTLGRGLWGVARRMGDRIQGAIQNPGGAQGQDDPSQSPDSDTDAPQ